VNVLVDTCVWSAALRRRQDDDESVEVRELRELIGNGCAVMMGPVRQELLSGVRSRRQFELLRDHVRSFPDLVLVTADYERAAEHVTSARARGVQGSNTDFLICAAAERRDLPIFTTDRDFELFAGLLPIGLHRPRERGVEGDA
jgi:predicted nucleic acid-binding protein